MLRFLVKVFCPTMDCYHAKRPRFILLKKDQKILTVIEKKQFESNGLLETKDCGLRGNKSRKQKRDGICSILANDTNDMAFIYFLHYRLERSYC